ncbi:MAG: hypothetical protein MUF09_08000 [Candidatus Nanopelagicales bacterium]|nr:hypothetical protein [Candidatus Nanopelagicales bacterium]
MGDNRTAPRSAHGSDDAVADVAELAREAFRRDDLRPGQREAMKTLIGGRSVLAVLPTGGRQVARRADLRRGRGARPGVVIEHLFAPSPVRHLLGALGVRLQQACGSCDTCRTGLAVPGPTSGVRADDDALAVATRVTHRRWGTGVVMDRAEQTIPGLFDTVGYRTLARDLVLDRRRHEPVADEPVADEPVADGTPAAGTSVAGTPVAGTPAD